MSVITELLQVLSEMSIAKNKTAAHTCSLWTCWLHVGHLSVYFYTRGKFWHIHAVWIVTCSYSLQLLEYIKDTIILFLMSHLL
jgi:hypothetical protein